MEDLETIKNDIEKLRERNIRVEADKAWEGSLSRRSLIALFTYLAIAIYLSIINVDRPWLNAIVPTIGFTLSTLTMPYFKSLWLKYFLDKKK